MLSIARSATYASTHSAILYVDTADGLAMVGGQVDNRKTIGRGDRMLTGHAK